MDNFVTVAQPLKDDDLSLQILSGLGQYYDLVASDTSRVELTLSIDS